MKMVLLAAGLVFVGTVLAAPQKEKETQPSPLGVNAKTREEIRQMEKKLAEAIESSDAESLETILADYFADAYNESETAMNKAGAIKSCKAGALRSYRFGESPRLSRSGEMVTIEGVAKASADSSSDKEEEDPLVRVRRIWTQKDGRWLLVAQMRYPFEEKNTPATGEKTRQP